MSGIITLKPYYGSIGGGGNYGVWSAVGGANLWAVTADGSDSTYAQYVGAGLAYPAFRLDMEDLTTLPAGARIRGFRANIKAAKDPSATTARTVQWRIHALNYGSGPPDWILTDHVAVNTTPTWYYGTWQTTVSYGTNIIPTTINGLSVEVFGFTTADVLIYEVSLEVFYDSPPSVVTGSILPNGSLADTASPRVSWTYGDDLVPQESFVVEVYKGSTPQKSKLLHSSGIVVSSANSYQLPITLKNERHLIRVAVAQQWPYGGPNNGFWSPWANSIVDVDVLPYPQPEMKVKQANGFVQIDVQHNANLLSSIEQSAGQGRSEWDSLTNLSALQTDTTESHSATRSYRVTLSSTGVCKAARSVPYIPAHENVTYRAKAFFKKDSTATACSVAMALRFYDGTGTQIGSDHIGDYVTEDPLAADHGWVAPSVDYQAPVGTEFVAAVPVWNAGVSTQYHYFDDPQLFAIDPDGGYEYVTHGRGGLLYGQHQTGKQFQDDDEFPLAGENRLYRRNASMQGGTTDWQSANGAGTVVATTSGVAAVDAYSLDFTRSGSTGLCQAYLPTVGYELVTPGEVFALYASFRAASTVRDVRFFMKFYGSAVNYMAYANVGGVDTSTDWLNCNTIIASSGVNLIDTLDGGKGIEVPEGAVYASFWIEIYNVVVGEHHYVDRLAAYKLDPEQLLRVGWQEGKSSPQTKNTKGLCTVEFFEPTELDPQWRELATVEINPVDPVVRFQDWDIKSNTPRKYRARTWRMIEDTKYASHDTDEQTCQIELSGVWLSHVDGVGYNFVYLDEGRTNAYDLKRTLTYFAGRTGPQIEEGENRNQTIVPVIQLATPEDVEAFDHYARKLGQLIYRDQRGRRLRGVLDQPVTTDAVYGQTVTFNFLLAGDQSVKDIP